MIKKDITHLFCFVADFVEDDLCVTNNCLGGNSNTLQANIWKAMGRTFTVPAGVFLPGINGKFYDGPTDDVMRKLGKQLQDNDL